jgi:hypothetical protein
VPEAASLSQGNSRRDVFECAVPFSWDITPPTLVADAGFGRVTVKDELDTEAINRKLIDALQKMIECVDAGRATRDSRLATIRHIARTTLDTLSKEKASGESAASVDG